MKTSTLFLAASIGAAAFSGPARAMSDEGFPAVMMTARGTIVSRPGVAIEIDDPRRRGRKARAILYCFSGAAVVMIGGRYFALNGAARSRVGSIVNDGVNRDRLIDAGETRDPLAEVANAMFRIAVDRCPIG